LREKYLLLSVVALTLVLAGCQTVTQPVPHAPSDLVGFPVSAWERHLVWQDNSLDEIGFYIYRKTTGNYSRVGVVLGNFDDFYSDKGLDPETSYTYKVTAYNYRGESASSNEVTLTTLSEPEEPQDGLVAYIEGRSPGGAFSPPGDWFHWDTLGKLRTSGKRLSLELRGTGSKGRSEAEIVRFEWIFGDGNTVEGEYTAHIYYTGDWYITLIVYDEQENFASETLKIEVKGL